MGYSLAGGGGSSGVPLVVATGTTFTVETNKQLPYMLEIYLEGTGVIYTVGTGTLAYAS